MRDLKEKIDNANSVAVLVPDDTSDEILLAAFAIRKAGGEKVFIVGGEESVRSSWHALFEDEALAPKDFAVSIDTSRFPIEELRYEKQGEKLVVFFTSYNPITKSSFAFEQMLPESDLVVAIGFLNEDEAKKTLASRLRNTNGQEFFFLKKGGTPPQPAGVSSLPLLSRLLARARTEKELNTFWSFLAPSDFTKTNTAPTAIFPMTSVIAALAGLPRFVVVLWQGSPKESVGGLIYSKDARALSVLSSKLGVVPKSDYFLIPDFNSFTEAELEARKLLKSTL